MSSGNEELDKLQATVRGEVKPIDPLVINEVHPVDLSKGTQLSISGLQTPLNAEKPPNTIGHYIMNKDGDPIRLGEGAFGVVWAGYDPDLERYVAIKIGKKSIDPTAAERFVEEAKIVARLRHGAIVGIFELIKIIAEKGETSAEVSALPPGSSLFGLGARIEPREDEGQRLCIVMELIRGHSLHEVLERQPNKRIPPDEATKLMMKLSEALVHIHGAGLVHRDIKPKNILMDKPKDGELFGSPNITDFGLTLKKAIALETQDIDGTPC